MGIGQQVGGLVPVRGLDTVRMESKVLLAKLELNLEKHISEFNEAHAAWKKVVIAKMREHLDLAERDKAFNLYIKEAEPESHEIDYRRVIAMLKVSVDDTVELTRHDFQQYFLDDWQWKVAHNASLQAYTNRH